MRLLLEGCYGYLLVPSLITKHLCHQLSRHQFPCSSISEEFNNQPMSYIRCYAYFLNFLIFLGILQTFKLRQEKRRSQILGVSQREFTFPCLSKLLFKVSMVISKKIELDFVLSETRVMDRIICYCIILLLRKACQVLLMKVGKMTYWYFGLK